jgi:hypothetical protein
MDSPFFGRNRSRGEFPLQSLFYSEAFIVSRYFITARAKKYRDTILPCSYTVVAMPWEFIEERLGKAFTLTISFPKGRVLYPDVPLDIDEWLTSAAETDEELRELNIPRIQFLQNRWPIQQFAQFEWEDNSSITRRALLALHMNHRAYILFSGGFIYHLVAGIEPQNESALYAVALSKVLHEPRFVPKPPTRVKTGLLDFATNPMIQTVENDKQSVPTLRDRDYLSSLLVGWIGPWISLPWWATGTRMTDHRLALARLARLARCRRRRRYAGAVERWFGFGSGNAAPIGAHAS